MRRDGIALGLALSLLPGCPRVGGAQTQSPEPPPSVLGPSPLAGRVGEVLELVVPLWGGGQQDLAELRGRPVLLDLADAPAPGREAAQQRYRALVEREGDAVVVVSVALDPEVAALPAAWTDDRPPFVLGWDPQGALAARLQLATLPTVLLLDPAGTIVSVHEGSPPDDAALDGWLATR